MRRFTTLEQSKANYFDFDCSGSSGMARAIWWPRSFASSRKNLGTRIYSRIHPGSLDSGGPGIGFGFTLARLGVEHCTVQ